MTNTVTSLSGDSSLKHSLGPVGDQRRNTTKTTGDPPPKPPPPPLRARARGMVRPVTRRRAPALPPPSVPADDFLDDMLELDPVLQNERNDVIWQRRVDHDAGGVAGARDERRRRPSPSPLRTASHCDRCRRVDETTRLDVPLPAPSSHPARASDFVELKSARSRANNDYVDEPSTVPDTAATTSSLLLRLSDLHTTRRLEQSGVPLKTSTKDSVDSSTSLRAAVTRDAGVTCGQCGGCRCASCRRTVLLCSCRSVDDDQGRSGGRSAVRTVLGVCMPCLCACWLRTVSTCRRCTNRPDICRCRVDSL